MTYIHTHTPHFPHIIVATHARIYLPVHSCSAGKTDQLSPPSVQPQQIQLLVFYFASTLLFLCPILLHTSFSTDLLKCPAVTCNGQLQLQNREHPLLRPRHAVATVNIYNHVLHALLYLPTPTVSFNFPYTDTQAHRRTHLNCLFPAIHSSLVLRHADIYVWLGTSLSLQKPFVYQYVPYSSAGNTITFDCGRTLTVCVCLHVSFTVFICHTCTVTPVFNACVTFTIFAAHIMDFAHGLPPLPQLMSALEQGVQLDFEFTSVSFLLFYILQYTPSFPGMATTNHQMHLTTTTNPSIYLFHSNIMFMLISISSALILYVALYIY